MTRALAKSTEIDENILAHRLMGNWSAAETTFEELVILASESENSAKPYPFYLAYALDVAFDKLGEVSDWQVERKWDGIRGQIIVREDAVFVWSRGEELVTDKFPEFVPLAEILPNGTVIDGEIICIDEDSILSFNVLQQRIGRKNITKKILTEAPIKMIAYDLLEYKGEDIRKYTLSARRDLLENVITENDTNGILKISKILKTETWEYCAAERAKSRENMSEGLMLKRRDSTYKSGRKKGDWWKWKVDPLTIDAVMIYAQRGHGRRTNLYTDYTFAVWNGEALVTFAKAYSGLTDIEFKEVTQFVRKNTVETFGPVRSVKPSLVFELAFEGINKSSRHKSGVALRFPRIKRWRKDKPAAEANTLQDLHDLLEIYG
jgi:DNA ligase-1